MLKVCIVAGARPNFIKVAPLVWAIDEARRAGQPICYQLVYTGEESDFDPTLFADLGIERPSVCLGAKGDSLNVVAGCVMGEFDSYLANTPTDVVVVVDDLASTMAVAIVAKRRGVRLAHLVAGTRAFDIDMPKEVNRLVIDGLSDFLFTAGDAACSTATREGAPVSRIYLVGNILMDTLRRTQSQQRRPMVLAQNGVDDLQYIVLTLNGRALLDNPGQLRDTLRAIASASAGVTVVAPLHGFAKRAVENVANNMPGLLIADALPYLEFGYLASHALGIVTDSGNVAEEATFNGVPCATLSSHAEHAETVSLGTNVLVGADTNMLSQAVGNMVKRQWKPSSLPDRWDGRTAERIVKILQSEVPCK